MTYLGFWSFYLDRKQIHDSYVVRGENKLTILVGSFLIYPSLLDGLVL